MMRQFYELKVIDLGSVSVIFRVSDPKPGFPRGSDLGKPHQDTEPCCQVLKKGAQRLVSMLCTTPPGNCQLWSAMQNSSKISGKV